MYFLSVRRSFFHAASLTFILGESFKNSLLLGTVCINHTTGPDSINAQNVMGSPKSALNFFSDYTPFDQVGGGGSLVPTLSTRCATRGGRGVLSSNFVHQMCHQGGEGGGP